METSSPRFKSLAITAGLSFWFSIITFSTGYFSFEILLKKISKLLDIFAIINTKIFLSILFILVISIYGILFRFLRIDLLRLKTQSDSYWLKIESSDNDRKQF